MQTLLLGLSGGVLGAALRVELAAAIPGMIAQYLTIDVSNAWDAWLALQGIAIACLTTLLFTVPPLLAIRDIRPAQVFRLAIDGGGRRRRFVPAVWIARGSILLGTGAVAGTLTE